MYDFDSFRDPGSLQLVQAVDVTYVEVVITRLASVELRVDTGVLRLGVTAQAVGSYGLWEARCAA